MRHAVLQRLKVLRAEIDSQQHLASAEAALEATDAESNPWKGAGEKLTSLYKEQRDLELAAEGEVLVGKLEQLKRLDAELKKAQQARVEADEAVRVAAEHESVQRWMRAGTLARAAGVGYDFAGVFSAWYLSGKARFAGAPQCVSYFMDNPATPAGLRFDEKNDRAPICRWHEAKGAANTALVTWCAHAEQRAHLLRENPELVSVA
jgi:hypothetical protein